MTKPVRVSRRTLLTSAVATGAAVTTGCRRSSTEPDDIREAAIFELSFSIAHRYRPFELIAPNFVQASQEDAGAVDGLVLSDRCPEAPFAAVEVHVTSAGRGTVVAGLATDDDQHVLVFYDADRRRAGIEVRRTGRTHLVRRKKVDLPDTFDFAFAVCENQVTALVDTGDGWRPLLTERNRVAARVDLRDPAVLAEHTYAWGSRPGSRAVELREVRAGLFGMTGIRDPHLVQHSDGRPYIRGDKAYLTMTCAGLGFFQQAHWGVFTIDLADPTRLEQVAQLYSRRDGLLLGDHAGQLVRDDDHGRWLVATSSWGDFAFDGVHVRRTTSDEDLLTGVHLLETEPLPLPTSVSAWDPGMTRVDGRWYIGFVESPSQKPFDFHPALARGPHGADWDQDLQPVGAAKDLHQCEGPILAHVEDRWWLLASDKDSQSFPVWNLEMHRVGRLDAPYPTNIPHPQIVPLPDGGHLMVSFEGTQFAEKIMGYGGHGDVVIMRSRAD